MKSELAKRWFLVPLPTALVVSYGIWLLRMGVACRGYEDLTECAGFIGIVGGLSFPIGLAGILWIPQQIMMRHMLFIAGFGYAAYLALTIIGLLKPTKALLIVLTFLLFLNMLGCQMERVVESLPIGE